MKRHGSWTTILCTALALSLAILAVGSPVSAGGVRVVASQNAPVDSLDDDTIKKIFLGKTSTWPDGSAVEFVVLESGDVHSTFLKAFVKKTPPQFKTYWKKQVFTGKGATPKSFASEAELVQYVAGRHGSVGYTSSTADVSTVKVLNQK